MVFIPMAVAGAVSSTRRRWEVPGISEAAALRVADVDPEMQIALRVDDHSESLTELRRLLMLFREKYEPIHRALPATSRAGQ